MPPRSPSQSLLPPLGFNNVSRFGALHKERYRASPAATLRRVASWSPASEATSVDIEAIEFPALIAAATEELLRDTTIVHTGAPRVAIEDVTVGGQLVNAGEACCARSIPPIMTRTCSRPPGR
jgi:hypothetical protein